MKVTASFIACTASLLVPSVACAQESGIDPWWAQPVYTVPEDAPTPAFFARTVRIDRSPVLARTGVGLTVAGAILGGVGAAVAFTPVRCHDGEWLCGLGERAIGSAMMVTGGAHALVGVPLWIAGEIDIDVPEHDPRARERRTSSTFVPRLALAPTAATLSWAF